MKRQGKRKRSALLLVLLLFLLFLLPGFYAGLCIQYYQLESEKIEHPVRIVLLTDLHSYQYRDMQQELIQAVQEQNPDMIAFSGDIFDEVMPDSNTELLLQGIAEQYPCYYVTGNHEYYSGHAVYEKEMKMLEKYHIQILAGTMEKITLNEQEIQICGIEDPVSTKFQKQFQQVQALYQDNSDIYTVLLSHRPEKFQTYCTGGFDLVLSGHAHGGQWRIPWLLNGLYAPSQGVFPEYAGGMYQQQNTTMIVSRGLTRKSPKVPRIYNRPEVVVIDIV